MSARPETERFAALLRSLKTRSGLSYEALARKSGLTGSTLHRYCRGTSVPQDYGSVHRLATVCGATPDELRTLHRLWALADAARTAAPATVGEAEDERPAQVAEVSVGERDLASDQDAPADAGPVTPVAGLRSRRRRLRTSVVAAALLAAVSLSAWAMSNGDSPNGGRTGTGTGDGRLLFSPDCPPVIAMGEHDACVREVQRLLHAKGADIDVDGDFGPQTLRRVTAFQVLAGLRPNGVVGEPTKKSLYTSRVPMSVWPEQKVRQRVREVFPEVPDKAVAIADCQSFLDPLHILPNTNGTRNWGLFQISDARLRELGGTPRDALDPEWNIRAARQLWARDRDFGDWPHCARAAEAPRDPTSRQSPSAVSSPG